MSAAPHTAAPAEPAVVESPLGVTSQWQILSATSGVSVIGSAEALPTQNVEVGAAVSPHDWRTLGDISLPTVGFAFGEFVELQQMGEASGSYNAASGIATLDLPLMLIDSSGGTAMLTAQFTTEATNGTHPDGSPACLGQPSDPTVCHGTRRNAATGQLRLVGIAQVPAEAGTIVDLELLLMELDGIIAEADTDGDGIEDLLDNCPSTANVGQGDIDSDALGDACDACTDLDDDGSGSPGDPACPRGGALDCNDLDAAVFPGGLEYCDGADNDCDVDVDEALCEDFDVDGDMAVDGAELAWVAQSFGLCSPTPGLEWWFPVDFNVDGCIDGLDLSVLGSVWACTEGPICE